MVNALSKTNNRTFNLQIFHLIKDSGNYACTVYICYGNYEIVCTCCIMTKMQICREFSLEFILILVFWPKARSSYSYSIWNCMQEYEKILMSPPPLLPPLIFSGKLDIFHVILCKKKLHHINCCCRLFNVPKDLNEVNFTFFILHKNV